MKRKFKTMDANEAVANVAYRLNEVIAIYPITPSSTMGEWADQWSSEGVPNIWGSVPTRRGNAKRRRRRRSGSWCAPDRSFSHDFHCIAGPAADDPQHE
jgi:hypothetical protein